MASVRLVMLGNIHLLNQLPLMPAKLVLMSLDVILVRLPHQSVQHVRQTITWKMVPVLPVPQTHFLMLDQLPQVTVKLALILLPDVLNVRLAHQHAKRVIKIIT